MLAPLALAALMASSAAVRPTPMFHGFIAKPYVQLGDWVKNGPNTLAILWHVDDEDHDFELTYHQGGKPKRAKVNHRTVKVDGIEPHRVYEAVLADLIPGKLVTYTVASEGRPAFEQKVMAPKSDRQEQRFAVFGDCGTNVPVQNELAFQTYLQKPDYMVITGDIVYDDGRISEYRENLFPQFTQPNPSAAEGAPIMSTSLTIGVPGNHDILNRDLGKYPDGLAFFYYWSQPLNGPLTTVGEKNTATLTGPDGRQRAFLDAAGPAYPRSANFSFDYGNAHWLCLDANRYVDWTDAKLRQWVKDDLAKAAKKTWRFVSFHQPSFHSSSTHQAEKQMRLVADLFEDGKVDVVFCGHVHNYQRTHPIQVGPKRGASVAELAKDDWPVNKTFDGKRNTKPNGVIYIVDGAGGRELYNVDLNGRPELWKPFQAEYKAIFSFSIVTLKGKKLVMTQLDNKGAEIDKITITK